MPRPRRQSSTVSTTEHAGDEEDAADGLRHDLAEEVGHRRDVAVDALDQLAGRVAAVELVVEAEHVAGDAQAQLVRRAPRRDRGEPGDDDGDDLRGHGDGEERQCQAHELGRAGPLRRLVDDGAHDERAGERQRRADREERAEDGPTTGVGPQEGEQGAPTRRGFNRHRAQSPAAPSIQRVGFASGALRPLATGSVLSSTLGSMEQDTSTATLVPSDEVADERARRGGAPRRGDLDRRDVRRLLTPSPASMLDRRLALDPQVALRPEPFGALAYHYGNRRLIFLKHPDVVRRRAGARRPSIARRRAAGVRHRRAPLAVVRRRRRIAPRLGGDA